MMVLCCFSSLPIVADIWECEGENGLCFYPAVTIGCRNVVQTNWQLLAGTELFIVFTGALQLVWGQI